MTLIFQNSVDGLDGSVTHFFALVDLKVADRRIVIVLLLLTLLLVHGRLFLGWISLNLSGVFFSGKSGISLFDLEHHFLAILNIL